MSPHTPPTLITEDEARAALSTHLTAIKACISQGWALWGTHYSHRSHILDSRARASIVSCEIFQRVRETFQTANGGEVRRVQGANLLLIENFAVRFKKLGKDHRTRNIRTRQQKRLELQLPIAGIPPATFLNAGYLLDDLEQEIASIFLTLQYGKSIIWAIDLDLETGTTEVLPFPEPLAKQLVPVEEPAEERARPKNVVPLKKTETPDGE